jgi:hypothetical protein
VELGKCKPLGIGEEVRISQKFELGKFKSYKGHKEIILGAERQI